MSDYLPPVVAKLEGDHSGLVRTLREGKDEIKAWAVEVGKTKVTLSVTAALKDGTLAALREKVKDSKAAKLDTELGLKSGTLTALRTKVKDAAAAKLDVSVTLQSGTLAALRQDIRDSSAAKLDVDLHLKTGALAAIRRDVADSSAAKLKVKLDLDSAQVDAIRAGVEGNELEVKVKPKMDQVAQRRIAVILDELGKRIDVTIRPTMNRSAQLSVQARLDRLSQDRTVTIRTRIVGGGGGTGTRGAAAREGADVMGAMLSLAPAAVPIAASLAGSALNIAANFGAAAVAVGSFGLALIPQLKNMGAAATAQQKLDAAVTKYGPTAQQAQAAQQAVLTALDGMPPATQRAAMGFEHLKDTFKKWSDGTARFTMDPVNNSFAVAEKILPKLTPMVQGTSTQLARLITLASGEVATPGFDAVSKRFDNFANNVVKHATDDLVHFSRILGEGAGRGPLQQFMQYAHDQGPAVRDTLKNLVAAIAQIAKGAAQAGPGMLTVVNAVAKLVAALPPSFIGRVMQVYSALKLYKLASSGVSSVSDGVQRLGTRLSGLRAAASGAGGGLAGVRAAIASISTGAKIGGAIAVIAGVALVLEKLSSSSKKAPDVNRMTTALGQLAITGKAGGELTRNFGADLDGLSKAIDRVSGGGSGMDKFNDVMNKVFTLGMGQSNSMKEAKKDIDAVDKGLASLVSSGHADQAARALADLSKAGVKIPKDKLDDYNSALADAAFESRLAAESMGTFGAQAQAVQRKLDAQKQAAQGLQQAILDLNDANRAALDAESAYQQAIDDATAKIKGHTNALHYNGGQLNLNSQKARDAYAALSQLAATAEAASVATLQQTGSQEKANRILVDAHGRLVATAEKMGMNSQEAHRLADALDNIKDPKIQVTVATQKAESDLAAAKKKIAAFPKTARTTANFSYQKAMADVDFFQRIVDRLHGKTVTVTINGVKTGVNASTYYQAGPHAYGGVIRAFAGGGTVPGYAPLRDTVQAVLSPGEGVLVPEAVRRLGGEAGINTINRQARSGGALSAGAPMQVGGFVASGLVQGLVAGQPGVASAAAGMGRAALAAFSAELGIASPSKKFRALGGYVVSGLVQGLTGSTASVKAATKRIAATLYVDFGSHHKSLQKYVDRENAQLLRLAAQRDSVASRLKSAQSKLASLQKAWTDERNQIASGIMQGTSIVTASPDASRAVNANDVITQMKLQVQSAQNFAAELRQLQKMGLRSDLIAQLAQAGPDQAGATALALAGGSKSQIQQLNALQGSLSTAANSTGAAVADSMYKAGIQSAQGLVKGLQSQERAIEAQMLRIAKAMQSAIKKALGIHSPSRVMAELGDHTARGMALGIERSTKHVHIAAQGMAMAARQGASLSGSGARAAGGGNTYVYVTVHGSVTAERDLVKAVEAGLTRGANRNPGGYRPTNPWNNRG